MDEYARDFSTLHSMDDCRRITLNAFPILCHKRKNKLVWESSLTYTHDDVRTIRLCSGMFIRGVVRRCKAWGSAEFYAGAAGD